MGFCQETHVSETHVSETHVSETQVSETHVSETHVSETQFHEWGFVFPNLNFWLSAVVSCVHCTVHAIVQDLRYRASHIILDYIQALTPK